MYEYLIAAESFDNSSIRFTVMAKSRKEAADKAKDSKYVKDDICIPDSIRVLAKIESRWNFEKEESCSYLINGRPKQ